jgi:hypothetical protein
VRSALVHILAIAVLAATVIYSFDRMMRADRNQLCANDATAYKECSK